MGHDCTYGEYDGMKRYTISYHESSLRNNNFKPPVLVYVECQDAPDSIAVNSTTSMTLKTTYVELSDYHPYVNSWLSIENGSVKDSEGHYMPFWSTGKAIASGASDSLKVSFKFPTDPKNGDTQKLNWHTDAADYTWTYTFKAGESDEDADTIGDDKDDEDDIVVDQVKNVKLTNKKVRRLYISYSKVSGAKGYQIRYCTKKSMKGAKKLNTKALKGYFKKSGKKVSFKKGKTYYAQVRAYKTDSSGQKVYGKWSARKKVKIKK